MANLTPVGVEAVIKNLDGFMDGLGKMSGGIANVGGAVVGLGAKLAVGTVVAGIGAITLAIGGLTTASKIGMDSLMGWGEQLDRLGDQFGMSGEQASMWTVAMNKVGLSVEEGGQGLNYFTRNLAAVKTALELGDKAASPFQQSLDKLGISAFDSTGAVRSLDSLMPEIMNKFQQMPAGVEASALAMELFGARGGTKFLDFLRQGSQGLSDADAMAKAFGLTMSTDAMNAIEEYGFSLNELNLGLTGIKNQIGEAVLPYAQKFVDLLIQNIPTIVNFATVLGDNLGKGLQIVTDLLAKFQEGGMGGLLSGLGDLIDTVIAGLPGVITPLVDSIAQFLRNNWPAIRTALFGWANAFWDWLTGPGGALEWAGQKIGELVGAISTEIVARWPGVRDALLAWAGKFWTWLTGPGGPVDLASSKIIEFVSAISTQLRDRWPYIQSELLFWAGEFWDWFTGPGGPVEVAASQIILFANAISTEIAKQWPGIRDALLAWGAAFWDWLTAKGGALDQLGANMNIVVANLNAWVSGPGKPALEAFGQSVGRSIVAGIKGLFESKEGEQSIVQRLVDGLLAMAASMQDSLKKAGLAIAKGIILGIVEGITGKEASEQLKTAVSTTLNALGKSISTMTNPLANITKSVKDLNSALGGLTIPSWLNPGSPTPLELGLRGIAGALSQVTGAAMPALTSALSISPSVTPATMPVAGGRAAMPLTAAGGGGGVTVNVNVGSVNNGMDTAMLGQYIRREVVAALG